MSIFTVLNKSRKKFLHVLSTRSVYWYVSKSPCWANLTFAHLNNYDKCSTAILTYDVFI